MGLLTTKISLMQQLSTIFWCAYLHFLNAIFGVEHFGLQGVNSCSRVAFPMRADSRVFGGLHMYSFWMLLVNDDFNK